MIKSLVATTPHQVWVECRRAVKAWAADSPGERCMGGATRMGDSDVINSHAPFSPCLPHLPSLFPLLFPCLQLLHRITLIFLWSLFQLQPDLPVPLSPALLSPPHFVPLSLPLAFFLFSELLFSRRDHFPTISNRCRREGQFYYPQSGVPLVAQMHARAHGRTHIHTKGWWMPMPLTDCVDWFRMVAASCRRVERLFLDQGVAGRERLRRALCVRVCKSVFVRNTAVLNEVSSLYTYIHSTWYTHTHPCTYAAVPL